MKNLYFVARDLAGCYGCRWIIATREEAASAGHILAAYTRQLTPTLIDYLRSIGFPGA